MRRLLLAAGLLGLAGCSNLSDLFSAHADRAASAGDLELKTARLGQILAGPKGAQLNRESALYVGNLWIDYSLFAQAVARRTIPTDSAAIAEVLWPEIAQMQSQHWFDTLLARRTAVGAASADSVYNGGSIRVFQHILFRVEPNAVPEERAAVHKTAEAALAKVKAGGDFGQIAAQLSQDPSARDSGYLGAWPRGKFVTAFDSAGWSLAPGAVSGIVETPYGYHIIKRPAARVVQGRLLQWLREGAGIRLDSLYLDSLALHKNIKVSKSAPAEIRAAIEDMEAQSGSRTTVASYDGGQLNMGEFLRWARQVLPPGASEQVKSASDSQLIQFVRGITSTSLLLKQADSAHITLTPVEWNEMRQQYAAQVDSLKTEMGISGADFADTTLKAGERVKVAALKLDQYFDALLAGRTRLRPMPATLAAVLRRRGSHKLYEAGLARGLEQAKVVRAKADSANGPGAPGASRPGAPAPGAMQQAPGPPPVSPAPSQRAPGK